MKTKHRHKKNLKTKAKTKKKIKHVSGLPHGTLSVVVTKTFQSSGVNDYTGAIQDGVDYGATTSNIYTQNSSATIGAILAGTVMAGGAITVSMTGNLEAYLNRTYNGLGQYQQITQLLQHKAPASSSSIEHGEYTETHTWNAPLQGFNSTGVVTITCTAVY